MSFIKIISFPSQSGQAAAVLIKQYILKEVSNNFTKGTKTIYHFVFHLHQSVMHSQTTEPEPGGSAAVWDQT